MFFRLGHNLFRRTHELDPAGGECEGVGAEPVRDQLQDPGQGRAGHYDVRRGDQQRLVSGEPKNQDTKIYTKNILIDNLSRVTRAAP